MKSRILNQISKTGWLLPIVALLFMAGACKKNNYRGFTPGSGAPRTISSVHTLGKTDTTVRYDTVYTYNSAGVAVPTLKQLPFQINPFDSVTTAGNVGNYYIIDGSNLGSATSVTFNGTAAFLNSAWNTDNTIIVAIPGNVAAFGPAATGTLVVTTLHGSATYKFTIIPPVPNIASFTPTTASPGGQMTIKGTSFTNLLSVEVRYGSGYGHLFQ